MSALTSQRTYAVLAAMQAAVAAAGVGPIAPVKKSLEDVGLPRKLWPLLPIVNAASAVGLLSVFRWPALARLTTFMLTVYFTLAVGSHVRAKDCSPNLVAASSLLTLFAAMTVKGPDVRTP
ncbi:DoxX family protein [Mycobacterium sp. ITM-2016-00317]|uniref:DoxX family protein n=1 Tax=Mycobacterium sp. ITM-2016-00317 TaxID=2099694 RepID=UPI000D4FDFEF|nr:DoxX family protein [Mycobacterium sp. ITM-2016-00317]WNG89941.1 DoxX family protein [Mycobacterium sp. ITM-2016-00317]